MGRTVEFRWPNGKSWKSHEGPQSTALLTNAFEVLYGGARGGGKSAALIAWLCMGNLDLPPDHPCHASYLNHKGFRALVLRRDATDLKEFVSEATAFFQNFGLVGGKKKEDPAEFHFPSGAIIYTNHLKNEDAFEKYKGWNLSKVGIEELTLIESERSYLKVLGSVRSPYPEIKPQVFCTTNPDGNGSAWVRHRFVSVKQTNGQLIPWGTKMRDPISGLTRVFIPAKLKDNPSLGEDYHRVMMLQDEKTRRAWLDGDWDALIGPYFSEFRPNGPLTGEPVEANHVIKANSVPLMPWWPRYIGMDWGFADNSAVCWLCNNQQDGRLHVYRELVANRVGSEQLGVQIAKATMPELLGQPDLQVPLYLSHDAFRVDDVTRTKAELIQQGIDAVLGAGSSLLANGIVRPLDPEDDAVQIAQEYGDDARIIIHRAGKERVGVWQYMRSLLRFNPMLDLGEPNQEFAKKLLEGENGFIRYEAYLNSFVKKAEVLPGILFWDNCPELIDEIATAIHDDKKPEDILEKREGTNHKDALNALRHALMMIRRAQNDIPMKAYMAQRLNQAEQYVGDPNIMWQVWRKANSDYKQQYGAGGNEVFRLPRASSRRVN